MSAYSGIRIAGTLMPDPGKGSVIITEEPMWSASTGRTTSGKMVGDIVARKATIKITWAVLTPAQVSTILTAVRSSDFFTVKYTDPTGTEKTKTMYASATSFTQYSWYSGARYIINGSVELIEQ